MKFDPTTGLIPAIIQDAVTHKVLMLGYMNQESFEITIKTGKITFWSRSRNEIWTKGETSGNFLHLKSWKVDCDQDTVLIKAIPDGPTCHKGDDTCWKETNCSGSGAFLDYLETIIDERYKDRAEDSYTSSLFNKGTNKIAQKVGEEAIELVIEAKDNDDDLFIGEAADLMFHYLVLLRDRGLGLKDIVALLKKRHNK
jgi:phosphoribosyl-AMP cyclohydrolase / phosphoribosyl-ATP pyrophosphohydrolase